ncbi:chitobiase/beta-hexosaminidase C-terminal domain-containing protein [Flagellimonas sp.]|uniref:chitobiase/beta-hexosaminidase C-terminal domain-containing protein n=1 Tax=Flagellimonas sp. TaxID=2058762 RepID=UPI003B52109E
MTKQIWVALKQSLTKSNSLNLLLMALLYTGIASCQSEKTTFLSTDEVQLAPPSIKVDSALFIHSALVQVQLAENGSVLRYSLDGSPVNESASVYAQPIELLNSAEVRVRAYHPQFTASEERTMRVRKLKHDISQASVELETQPNASYPGNGTASLTDGQKGSVNFRQGGYWLGFQENEIGVKMKLDADFNPGKIILSMLQDQGSWIFLPQAVQVHSNGKIVGSKEITNSTISGEKQLQYIEIPVSQENNQEFTISIHPLQKIPDWHPGKGTLPWTFIDEIIIE